MCAMIKAQTYKIGQILSFQIPQIYLKLEIIEIRVLNLFQLSCNPSKHYSERSMQSFFQSRALGVFLQLFRMPATENN